MSAGDTGPDAPAGLSILPESNWTDYDRRIWDEYDAVIDDTLRGNTPYPEKACIGRYKGQPALIARFYTDHLTDGWGLGVSHGTFARKFTVSSWVLTYPEPMDSVDGTYYDDVPFTEDQILEGDAEYDVFAQIIPSEFVDWVTGDLFPEDWAEHFYKSEENPLQEFVKDEVGSVDSVVDPTVRAHLKRLIEASSSSDAEE